MNKYKITKKKPTSQGLVYENTVIHADEIRDTGQFVDFYQRTVVPIPILVYRIAVNDVHSIEVENA